MTTHNEQDPFAAMERKGIVTPENFSEHIEKGREMMARHSKCKNCEITPGKVIKWDDKQRCIECGKQFVFAHDTHHSDLHKYRTAPQGVWQHIYHGGFTDGKHIQGETIYVDGSMPAHHSEVEGLMFDEGIFYEDENKCVHVRDVPSTILLTIRNLLTTSREKERERIVDWLKDHGYYHEEHRGLFKALTPQTDVTKN